MTKNQIELKLKSLLNQKVTIVNKIKHSPNHMKSHINEVGTLNSYDIGDSHSGISVEIIVYVIVDKKVPRSDTIHLWVDSRDIVE